MFMCMFMCQFMFVFMFMFMCYVYVYVYVCSHMSMYASVLTAPVSQNEGHSMQVCMYVNHIDKRNDERLMGVVSEHSEERAYGYRNIVDVDLTLT